MESGPKNDVPVIQVSPEGNMSISVTRMIPGIPHSFLYRGKEPAVAIKGKNNSVKLTRVFEPTRNPIVRLMNKWREPILTTPPFFITDD